MICGDITIENNRVNYTYRDWFGEEMYPFYRPFQPAYISIKDSQVLAEKLGGVGIGRTKVTQ